MANKRRKNPYYGKKGGVAVYKNEMTFGLSSTLSALKDYYKGKLSEVNKD